MGSMKRTIYRGAAAAILAATVFAGSATAASASTVLFDRTVLVQYMPNFARICRNLGGHFSTRYVAGPFIDVKCTR